MEETIEGGCQCGQVRYRINGLLQTLYCCHCTECQQQAASAFGMSLRISGDQVTLDGRTASFIRDKGQPTACECIFCPDCGTRFMHRRDEGAANASIKAGSLDRPLPFDPVGHIWTRSKLDWVILPEGHLVYEEQPDDRYRALISAFKERYGDRQASEDEPR